MDHIRASAAPRRVAARAALLAAASFLAVAAHAATFTVTTTADAGAGSLRWAIEQANQQAGPDAIRFNLPGTGVKTISPRTPLPAVADAVTIDAATQPGYAGAPLVALDGYYTGPPDLASTNYYTGPAGLTLSGGSGSIVRGLCIKRFPGVGIHIGASAPDTSVEGCYIGIDPNGAAARPNYGGGIQVESQGNTIGGSVPAKRNVISGNGQFGINLGDFMLPVYDGNNVIRGNYIGTDACGTGAIGNGYGIVIRNGHNEIGGDDPADGNVISGNWYCGISLHGSLHLHAYDWTQIIARSAAHHNAIKNNKIGTDATGRLPLGNRENGIDIYSFVWIPPSEADHPLQKCYGNVIGTPTAGNVIAYNRGCGVSIRWFGPSLVPAQPDQNPIVGNSIFMNGGLGINLNFIFPEPNDALDADTGPNDGQNYPVIESVVQETDATAVAYTLRSRPSARFTLHFYRSSEPHRSKYADNEYGQGEHYLGAADVVTDAAGNAAGRSWFSAVPCGSYITATATDERGNTSEFSKAICAVSPEIASFTPRSGGVGTRVTITGANLAGTTGVRFNGVTAWFSVVSDTQVVAKVPSGATTGKLRLTTPVGTTLSADDFTVVVPLVAQDFACRPFGSSYVLTATGGYIAVNQVDGYRLDSARFTAGQLLPYAQGWTAAGVSTIDYGSDVLFAEGDRRFQIWRIYPDGSRSSDARAFSTDGWRAAGIASALDHSERVLLLSPTGQARISRVTHPREGAPIQALGYPYHPAPGWQFVGIAASGFNPMHDSAPDVNTYLLARDGSRRYQVWTMNAAGGRIATTSTIPTGGWTATDVAVCGYGGLRVLLLGPSGRMRLHRIEGATATALPASGATPLPELTAPEGWEFVGISGSHDSSTQVLLRSASGQYRLWTLDFGGKKTDESPVYGG